MVNARCLLTERFQFTNRFWSSNLKTPRFVKVFLSHQKTWSTHTQDALNHKIKEHEQEQIANRMYSGTVIDCNSEKKLYSIRYEDGDTEDISEEELDNLVTTDTARQQQQE